MASDFLSVGLGAASATGVRAKVGAGTAAGTGGSSVKGRGAMPVAGSAAGVGAGAGVGATIVKSIFQSFGESSALFVGVNAGTFSAEGTSEALSFPTTMDGVSSGSSSALALLSATNAQAAGSASASAATTTLRGGAGVSAGTSTAAAEGGISWASFANETDAAIAVHGLTLSAAGIATSTASSQVAVYTSSGVASSEIDLLEKRNSVGQAAGVSGASAVGVLEEILTSSGTAADSALAVTRAANVSSGAAVSELQVLHHRYIVGRAVGASSVIAQAVGGANGVGESVSQSTASWSGRAAILAAAAADGAAIASGALDGLARSVAHAAGAGTGSAVRRGKQVEILVSSGEAEESMQFPLPSVYPVFWSNTIAASGATWDGLPFNSMIEVDGVMYAAGASGLFKLNDQGSDAGSDVPSMVEWDLVDINRSDYKQRTRSIYINAVAEGPFIVKVENKQGAFSYQTQMASTSKTVNHRAPIGRGITSRAMRLTLQQTRYCSVSDINLVRGDTTRRI